MNKRFIYLFIFILPLSLAIIERVDIKVPKSWPAPMYDQKKNPLNQYSVALGRMLFYDPVLSKDSTISCASCHSPYNAFAHTDHNISHGIDDRIGIRNAPALMNLAWQPTFMWDGAIHHLDVQALAPIEHPDEMGEKFEHVVNKLNRSSYYPTLFKKAYGSNKITGEHVLKSIAQFMLTLISADSKYDRVMNKKDVFNDKEMKGYMLYKMHCAECHREPLFTDYSFRNNGLPLDTSLNDFGRMRITLNAIDSLKFKVPTLRNIEYSYPYMHDGRFKKLSQVMNHYTSGIESSATLDPLLKKSIHLTPEEKVDLIAFLLTLTDKKFIFNQSHHFPQKEFQHKLNEKK